ncbi:serpin peptidase inhibitor, clade F (alpha-2 antiplasmin, pigment epithelium derived factor), member 2b [Carcharodon carcharias]|uniref:serpin peptidase inhibitor, clade F (alpha-2 antiplasmin, pigment epithelium derived factor), member 2b n=1 Tax=Carcharodon carcharias TaxID=13397 RepID=UPI001B7F1E48|nr:serpin peptidase inhibitor, clade F (alpha-2 antiplasmin, pigment epithelium derived factor), member 2b [Carcharodon carcharias]
MNTWIVITFLLCFTKPTRTSDSEDVIKVPENASKQTSVPSEDVIEVPENTSNETSTQTAIMDKTSAEQHVISLIPLQSSIPLQQVTDKMSIERNKTVTTELSESSAPHSSQSADTEQPDIQLASPEQPDIQLSGTKQPDTASVAPAPAEMPVKGNSSGVTESPGSIEPLTEQFIHVAGEEPMGDCRQAGSPGEMQLLGNAISEFGLDLFKEILQESSKPNIIISPLSIALGLAQLRLGSVNRTEKQIEKTLRFTSLNCSHYTLCTAINNFTRSALSIASSIYIKKGFHIKPEFIKDSAKFYNSQPQVLTGVSAKDTNMINSWVQQMTGRKIKTFLNEVPSNIVLLLLNAIHFKGLWQVQFDPRATSEDTFYKEDGSSKQVAMMQHPKYPISSFHDDDLQIEVARLSFKQNMSFIVVKPMVPGRLNSIVSKLNITELLGHFFKARPMPVKMPKLNINFDTELRLALKSLGLGNLFTNPTLSKISSDPLFVSSVQHKATMELKEEGVEAAASTGIAVSRSFMQCNINRPFFFIIRDDISGIPIFLGTIKDPKPWDQRGSQDKLMVNLERMRKAKAPVDPK